MRNTGQVGQAGQLQSLLYAYGPEGFAAQRVTAVTTGPVLQAPTLVVARAESQPRTADGSTPWLLGGLAAILALIGTLLHAHGRRIPLPLPARVAPQPAKRRARRTGLARLAPWFCWLLALGVLAAALGGPVRAAPEGAAAPAAVVIVQPGEDGR